MKVQRKNWTGRVFTGSGKDQELFKLFYGESRATLAVHTGELQAASLTSAVTPGLC